MYVITIKYDIYHSDIFYIAELYTNAGMLIF